MQNGMNCPSCLSIAHSERHADCPCSIYREIKILRYLGHHPNIIRILHLQRPNDLTNFKDL